MLPGLGAKAGLAGVRQAITITDDGDAAPSSGTGTATHTYNSQTSTGPDTILCVTAYNGTTLRLLSSATWNGVALSIKAATGADFGSDTLYSGILHISGAQSGNIVLNFDGTTSASYITKLSLANLQSSSAVDNDADTDSGGAANLDNLTSPGEGGIRIGVYANMGDTTGVTWTNATEVADLDAGSYRHSVAHALGDSASTITANGAAAAEAIAGVSLR